VDVKTIAVVGEFPTRMPHHHLHKNPVFIPNVHDFILVIGLDSFPSKVHVVNEPKPQFLQQLVSRLLNIVKNCVVMF
jgi:hypothetical protein